MSAVPVPLSHQHLPCPPCALLKRPPAPALSSCLGLPRQRPHHTNGVKRPAAVLCPEAPEGLSLDRTHRSLPPVRMLQQGTCPGSSLCRSGLSPGLAGLSLQVTTPRSAQVSHPLSPTLPHYMRSPGCAVRNSPAKTARPSVRRGTCRLRGELSGELWVSSRPAHPLPFPPAPSADVLGLACLFFFFSLQTSPKSHFTFKEISEEQLMSAQGSGSHGSLSTCVPRGRLHRSGPPP